MRLTDYAPPGLFVDLGARRQAESLFDQAAGFGDSWGRWETGRGSGWEVAVRGGLLAADVLSIALPAANAVGVAVRASAGITRTAVTAYEVGEYNALRLRAAGTGLEIHHLPQAHLAEQIIPGYARASGLAIALPRSVHRNLSAASRLRGDFSNITAQEARGLLGRQLRDLRNADVPKDALRVLGREMRARYGSVKPFL